MIAQFVLFAVIGGAGLRDVVSRGGPGSWGLLFLLAGIAAVISGGLLAIRASWDLRASFSPFPRPIEGAPLVQTGAYKRVRHPIYSGIVLAGLGWSLVTSSILAALGTGLLLILFAAKSRREEAWLEQIHSDYGAYRQRTKRLIPWIY